MLGNEYQEIKKHQEPRSLVCDRVPKYLVCWLVAILRSIERSSIERLKCDRLVYVVNFIGWAFF